MKIVTWNVHGFTDRNRQKTYQEIKKFIFDTDADVVCLQELSLWKHTYVSKNQIAVDFANLGYSYAHICPLFTNGVFSKLPFETIDLELGKNLVGRYLVPRSAIFAFFGNTLIINTHLDVFDDSGETRIKMCNGILNILRTILKDNSSQSSLVGGGTDLSKSICTVVICGDMNSLQFSDYNDKQLATIIENDRARGVTTIEDVIPLFNKEGFQDVFTGTITKTCVFDRRVDYILIKDLNDSQETLKNKLSDIRCIETNLSDHYALAVSIETKKIRDHHN